MIRPIIVTYIYTRLHTYKHVYLVSVHHRLTQAASASWDQLKLQTTAGLQDALKTRKHFEVDVTLHSPYLVVPENGCYRKDSHLLIVDLGQLTLNGSTKDPRSLDDVCVYHL